MQSFPIEQYLTGYRVNNMVSPIDRQAPHWLRKIGLDMAKIRVYGRITDPEKPGTKWGEVLDAFAYAREERKGRPTPDYSTVSGLLESVSPTAKPEGLAEYLMNAAELAAETDAIADVIKPKDAVRGAFDCIEIDDFPLKVMPHGSSSHRLLLVNNAYGVQVHLGGKLENLGVMAVKFGARWFHERGYTECLHFVAALSAAFCIDAETAKLSEVHLKYDTDRRFTETGLYDRARGRGGAIATPYKDRQTRQFSGVSTAAPGRQKPCNVVVYDKIAAERSDPYWASQYADYPHLWRVECRFTAPKLREYGIIDPIDLTDSAAATLWDYAVKDYFYCVTKETERETRKDRMVVAPFWREIQAAGAMISGRLEKQPVEQNFQYDKVLRQGVGCFKSAIVKAGIANGSTALEYLLRQIDAVLTEVDEYVGPTIADAIRKTADKVETAKLPTVQRIGEDFRREALEALQKQNRMCKPAYVPAFSMADSGRNATLAFAETS